MVGVTLPYALSMMPLWPQSQSENFGDKINILPLSGIEQQFFGLCSYYSDYASPVNCNVVKVAISVSY